ncbi:MAG: DUF4397 domain-containing protein [Rubrivivax sp.]|nr:DUF4397 domain-containing protein [Rubrivivax sp.]
MKRRTLLTSGGAIALTTLLQACGGGGGSSSARLRLINVSTGYASLDLYLNGTLFTTGVAYGNAGAYESVGSGTQTTAEAATGSDVYLNSQTRTLNGGMDVSLLAYGWEGALKVIQLNDNDSAPAGTSEVKLRVLNAAPDAGTLDVYVTGEGDALQDSAPVVANVGGGTGSGYVTLQAGTYRVRVTASGDISDIRMDVSQVSLPAAGIMSLILVSGSGGTLVRGLTLPQGGAPTELINGTARVRVLAAVDGNPTVTVSAGTVDLISGARAPTIGTYVNVNSGTVSLTVNVGGVDISAPDLTAANGSDYSVLIYGDAGAPLVTVLTDDNRLPTSATDFKIRLLHAASSLADSGLTMTVDYAAVASNVPYGSASAYDASGALTSALIEVSSPVLASPIYALADVPLVAQGVYTVYVLMNGGNPVGVLRRDR